jgi:hypothetical protein
VESRCRRGPDVRVTVGRDRALAIGRDHRAGVTVPVPVAIGLHERCAHWHVWDSKYQASADAPGRAATQDGKADWSVDLVPVRSPGCYSTVG